jgi:hypothetical protein
MKQLESDNNRIHMKSLRLANQIREREKEIKRDMDVIYVNQ